MWTLAMIAVGILIGWNFPQPQYAKDAQSAITTWAKGKWDSWVK